MMSPPNTRIRNTYRGGPVTGNTLPPRQSRTVASDGSKRVRKFWWSPKRNEVEIRSEKSQYQNVPSKIGSLDNIRHNPGGGQISIRDETLRWQATSKIDSLSNAKWSPPPTRVAVRTERLRWDVEPKIGSLDNIDHRAAGGNIAIRDERVDVSHIAPRVDCGFVD